MNLKFLREEAARFRGMAETQDREASKQRYLAMTADYESKAVLSDLAPDRSTSLHKVPTRSGGYEDMEGNRCLPHVLPSPRCCRNMLTHSRPAAKEVPQLVVASAIARR